MDTAWNLLLLNDASYPDPKAAKQFHVIMLQPLYFTFWNNLYTLKQNKMDPKPIYLTINCAHLLGLNTNYTVLSECPNLGYDFVFKKMQFVPNCTKIAIQYSLRIKSKMISFPNVSKSYEYIHSILFISEYYS